MGTFLHISQNFRWTACLQATDEASPLPRPPEATPLVVITSNMTDSDDEGSTADAAKKLLADTGGMCAWQAAILNEFIAAHGFEAAQVQHLDVFMVTRSLFRLTSAFLMCGEVQALAGPVKQANT